MQIILIKKNIKDKDINNMSHDAIAIVMLLCRLKNLDSYIQQEVIFAINYLINFDESLLVEPLKWFFKNCHYFPQLSLSALLEVLSLYAENKHDFLKNIIEDITSISTSCYKKYILYLTKFENQAFLISLVQIFRLRLTIIF